MTELERDPLIDAAIAALPEVHLPAELRRKVAQIPIVHGQGWMWPQWSWKATVAWALCAAMGVASGVFLDVGSFADPSASALLPASDLDVSQLEEQEGEDNLAAIDQLFAQAWGYDWDQELAPGGDPNKVLDPLEERAQ